VVFKVLGSTRRTIFVAFLLEYGLLGLATGLVAGMVGSLAAWYITFSFMGGEWVFLPTVVTNTLLLALLLTLILGFAGTYQALGQKAAPLLRNE